MKQFTFIEAHEGLSCLHTLSSLDLARIAMPDWLGVSSWPDIVCIAVATKQESELNPHPHLTVFPSLIQPGVR